MAKHLIAALVLEYLVQISFQQLYKGIRNSLIHANLRFSNSRSTSLDTMTHELRWLPKMPRIVTFAEIGDRDLGSQLARHKKFGILSHENKSSNANGMVHAVFEGS